MDKCPHCGHICADNDCLIFGASFGDISVDNDYVLCNCGRWFQLPNLPENPADNPAK